MKGTDTLFIIVIFAAFALVIYCFLKEKSITGMYKVAHIYGRVYAYLAIDFLFAGLAYIVMLLIVLLGGEGVPVTFALLAVVLLAAGIGMYYNVYRKSPDFLKKRCLIDLTISGIGTAARLTFFFLMFIFHAWWSVNKPETYRLASGTEVYIFPDGMVYDASTNRYGKVNDNRTEVYWEE